MKKVILGLVLLFMGGVLITPMASAYTISVGDDIVITTGALTGDNGGGAFYINKFGDVPDEGVLFTTFCLERDEYFYPGYTYNITSITNEARAGGIDTDAGDPLSMESAWLFNQWTTKGIAQTAANATAIQLAIWKYEGEWTADLSGDALTYFNNASVSTSYYGIKVLNLYGPIPGGVNGKAQDLLIQNPVPIPGAIWLLGSGLLGLVAVRRRRK